MTDEEFTRLWDAGRALGHALREATMRDEIVTIMPADVGVVTLGDLSDAPADEQLSAEPETLTGCTGKARSVLGCACAYCQEAELVTREHATAMAASRAAVAAAMPPEGSAPPEE